MTPGPGLGRNRRESRYEESLRGRSFGSSAGHEREDAAAANAPRFPACAALQAHGRWSGLASMGFLSDQRREETGAGPWRVAARTVAGALPGLTVSAGSDHLLRNLRPGAAFVPRHMEPSLAYPETSGSGITAAHRKPVHGLHLDVGWCRLVEWLGCASVSSR